MLRSLLTFYKVEFLLNLFYVVDRREQLLKEFTDICHMK